MLTDTPSPVPLTAGSLALLDSPEHGEDPSIMLLRRVLNSPHVCSDPNAPDDDNCRRDEMDTDAGMSHASNADVPVPFDATNGSFVAYLAPRSQSTNDGAAFADMFASKLNNGTSRRVGQRGSVAHDAGVQSFTNEGGTRVTVFRGVLRNKKTLARDAGVEFYTTELDSSNDKKPITCAELIDKLYDQCGVAFVEQLEGFFAFAVVDADAAGGSVFAATDRHGTLPLLKGRCVSGGIVIAHVGVNGGGDDKITHNTTQRSVLDRQMVGGASVVPEGTYVLGNRHCRAHKYCRSADHERALREMRTRDASYASLGDLYTEKHSSLNCGASTRGMKSRDTSFSDLHALRSFSPALESNEKLCEKSRLSKELKDDMPVMISRRSSVKELEGWNLGEMKGWSSQGADFWGEGDMQCESRMGASFQNRLAAASFAKDRSSSPDSNNDFLSRLGSGASDQSAVKVDSTDQSPVMFPEQTESPRGHKRDSQDAPQSMFDTFERDESECFVSYS